jgi:phospholipid/cholesterol/gamma-HCH transport system ATP-binding protein
MIKIEAISKSFSDRDILKGISVDFEPGKTSLIIGGSGSGKTVFMKCMVGLFEISQGRILYDERDFTKMDFRQKKTIRQEIGMVFQGGALFDSMTVEENVIFPLSMFAKMDADEKRERANFCLKRVNLVNANKQFPSELSGGMKKRVAIARAIAMNPKYLFCDEPNSGLDPKTSIVIDNLIQEITKEYNITTVINTHDMNSVIEIGDKIVFVYKGEKWWEGNSKEIFSTSNQELEEFIFASKLLQKLKK